MAEVVTQNEIMKFAGTGKAVFSQGTIITPSAADWAREHKINIVMEGGHSAGISQGGNDAAELLRLTVKAVLGNMDKAGGMLKKDELVNTVSTCLRRLGCKVE